MTIKSRHVSQETANFNDIREFAAWAFVGLKLPNGDALIASPQTYGDWSEQFGKAGFLHVSQLQAMAEGDVIPVSSLPKQQIEYHPPRRGQNHWLNPTGKWVPVGTDREEALGAPDMAEYTHHEQADVVEQLAMSGRLSPTAIQELAAAGLIRLENLVPEALLSRAEAEARPSAPTTEDVREAFASMPDPVIDTSALDNRPPPPPKASKPRKKKK